MDWKEMLSQIREDLPEGEMTDEEGGQKSGDAGSTPPKRGKLRIFTEKKGRKGKVATIVEGFECDDEELEEIASKAKRHLGVGGSARGGEILIQGDCRERLGEFLKSLGFKI